MRFVLYLASVLRIVLRSLRQHLLSTLVTIGSVGLAAGLVMSVFSVAEQSRLAFSGGPVGFDAVLGARGSQLQLVLNTVFHLETSPGNIPWSLYEEVRADDRVALAIPYAVGDNYKGYRIVGTDERIFTEVDLTDPATKDAQERANAKRVAAGEEPLEYAPRTMAFTPGSRAFDPTRREAVVGSYVAARTGLTVGSTFYPSHGVRGVQVDDEHHDDETGGAHDDHAHDDAYVVVGVLEPSNTPGDRVIWIPIEGIYRMDGHYLRGEGETLFEATDGEEIPEEVKEVSAVMLKFHSNADGFFLGQDLNRAGGNATLAWPISASVAQLFNKLGWVSRVLELVAYLVVLVATGSILASLYNTMNERRREFAILRALGARRRTVFAVILAESSLIAVLGSLVGFACYGAILSAAAGVVRAETGVVLEVWSGHPALWWTPVGMLVLGGAAGLLPAFKAYATDVARTLSRS